MWSTDFFHLRVFPPLLVPFCQRISPNLCRDPEGGRVDKVWRVLARPGAIDLGAGKPPLALSCSWLVPERKFTSAFPRGGLLLPIAPASEADLRSRLGPAGLGNRGEAMEAVVIEDEGVKVADEVLRSTDVAFGRALLEEPGLSAGRRDGSISLASSRTSTAPSWLSFSTRGSKPYLSTSMARLG